MSQTRFDLGFGNSPAVREAFIDVYKGNMLVMTHADLDGMDYPDRDGDKELIEITKKVIERQIGIKYRHIVLTNGATGGVVIALRAFKEKGALACSTRPAPWYLRYPMMIKAAGLVHVQSDLDKTVSLIDLPSNPLNEMARPTWTAGSETIIDGVYLNKVYTDGCFKPPRHAAMVGSYSKLTGMNGIRIGWVATNNSLLYARMRDLAIAEYCGLSVPSVTILKRMLLNYNWEVFETMARVRLDWNRTMFSKLEKYFGGTPVSPRGMFYYAPVDKQATNLLEKAGIEWTKGSLLGTNDGFGRFNLGQRTSILSDALQAIRKADTIR